jgi:hypothetical protein
MAWLNFVLCAGPPLLELVEQPRPWDPKEWIMNEKSVKIILEKMTLTGMRYSNREMQDHILRQNHLKRVKWNILKRKSRIILPLTIFEKGSKMK